MPYLQPRSSIDITIPTGQSIRIGNPLAFVGIQLLCAVASAPRAPVYNIPTGVGTTVGPYRANTPVTLVNTTYEPIEYIVGITPALPGERSLVISKMQRAMTNARGNNSDELEPWFAAPLWATGITYPSGWFVRNSAGNLYQMHPAQAATASGATEPTHVDNTGVYDGGGSSGCLWFYRGVSTGVNASTPFQGLPPTTNISVPTGVLSFVANDGGFSATASMIVPGTGANGAPVGQGLITLGTVTSGNADRGSGVNGASVVAGTQILSWNSGSGGTGSIGIVNISQTVVSTTLSFGGVLSAAPGLGLTYTTTVSTSNMPVTVTGGPVDPTNSLSLLAPNQGTVAVPSYPTSGKKPVISFETNARWVAIMPAGPIYSGDGNKLKFEVDGRLLHINRPNVAFTSANNMWLLDLTKLPRSKSGFHVVRVHGSDDWTNTVFYRVAHGPNDYVGPLQIGNSYKMSFEGDSLTDGGNGTPYDNFSALYKTIAALLGCDNVYNNAVGGTGFLANSNNSKTNYIQRIDRVNLFAPDIHLSCGNHNDVGNGVGGDGILRTSATRVTAVMTYHSAFRTANPNAVHIITGSKVLQGDPFTGLTGLNACENDLATAVSTLRAAGDNLVFFVPVTTDPNGDTSNNSGWYTGGSAVGRYFYNTAPYTDGHPLPADHDMFAHRVAQAVRQIVSEL